MSIEDLTKHQIVLLCFLIAFVSAVASAITVVTLMDQAPVTTSPTINKIIQQIVPGETREITKTNTVIIREEDIIVESINENKDSVVAIHETLPPVEGAESKDIINSSGLVISKDGFVVADSKNITGPGQYYYMDGDKKISLEFVKSFNGTFSLLKIKESDIPSKLAYSSIEKVPNPKIGARVILLTSNTSFSALSGSISSIDYTTDVKGNKSITELINDISLSLKYIGGIIVNTDGDVIGLVITDSDSVRIIPIDIVYQSILEYKKNGTSEQTANVKDSLPKEGEGAQKPTQ